MMDVEVAITVRMRPGMLSLVGETLGFYLPVRRMCSRWQGWMPPESGVLQKGEGCTSKATAGESEVCTLFGGSYPAYDLSEDICGTIYLPCFIPEGEEQYVIFVSPSHVSTMCYSSRS